MLPYIVHTMFYGKGILLRITEKSFSFKSEDNVFYYVCMNDDTWYKVHNDSLDTARQALEGVESGYIREVTGKGLKWFEQHIVGTAQIKIF